jgi:hypothetical protein
MQADDSLLAGLDLSQFSESQQAEILQNLYTRLEDKVGDQVAAIVSDEQFAEFEDVVAQANDERLNDWLDHNIPTYAEITESVLEQLKQEVAANPQSFL